MLACSVVLGREANARSPGRNTEPHPVRHLPRNLACLTNAAIAIVRCKGRLRYVPEANRHYAARIQDALDTILTPPTA